MAFKIYRAYKEKTSYWPANLLFVNAICIRLSLVFVTIALHRRHHHHVFNRLHSPQHLNLFWRIFKVFRPYNHISGFYLFKLF